MPIPSRPYFLNVYASGWVGIAMWNREEAMSHAKNADRDRVVYRLHVKPKGM